MGIGESGCTPVSTSNNHCFPNPCEHGTCMENLLSGYVCQCSPGYKGTLIMSLTKIFFSLIILLTKKNMFAIRRTQL